MLPEGSPLNFSANQLLSSGESDPDYAIAGFRLLKGGLQNRSGTCMCRRGEHASAGRDKGGAALPRPVACM
jgi:hypothetical protein